MESPQSGEPQRVVTMHGKPWEDGNHGVHHERVVTTHGNHRRMETMHGNHRRVETTELPRKGGNHT